MLIDNRIAGAKHRLTSTTTPTNSKDPRLLTVRRLLTRIGHAGGTGYGDRVVP
jgi:hypothetical protein